MATAHIVLAQVSTRARAQTGSTMPLPDSAPVDADTVTPTSTSTPASPIAGSPQTGLVWSIVADVAIWVNFGAGTPVAAADSGWYIPAGIPREFAVTVPSEKCAVKLA